MEVTVHACYKGVKLLCIELERTPLRAQCVIRNHEKVKSNHKNSKECE